MSVQRALAAIEQLLVTRTGPMGKIIYQRELNALGKRPEAITPEEVDGIIARIGKAITTILGQSKAAELQRELSTTAISILYGGKTAADREEAGTFQVVQAFFVLNDGRLLAHTSVQQDENVDSDIVSSMLTAVQGFIAESLGRGESGALDELKYGNRTVLMERKGKLAMAVVVSGQQFAPVRHYMKQAVDEIIEAYGPTLESWDGEVARIKGIQYYTDVLCLSGPVVLEEGPEAETQEPAPTTEESRPVAVPVVKDEGEEKAQARSVEVLREFEFYGGYIRIKVAVKNHMPTVVTNVSLKLSYNDTALRFDRLEPAFEMHGPDIAFGNVGANEKKSLSIFLDPVICMDSFIDGVLTYRDAGGSLETIKMDRKLVSIVCPMLYTDTEINSAMLKRMIKDELTHQDTRYYKFDKTDWETTLTILKGALGHHDIKLVREIQWDKDPQTVEVWYFAQIKGRKDHLVVRLSVWKAKKVLLLFVASESLLIVTGFLAEMRHDISKELEKHGLMPMSFMPIFEHEATSILGRHQPLIMKVSDGEIDPDSTEQ